jgi:hypothetical protein
MASQPQLLDLPLEMLLDVAEALIPQNTMILTVARDHQGWKRHMNDQVYLWFSNTPSEILLPYCKFSRSTTLPSCTLSMQSACPVTIPELDFGGVSSLLETTTHPAEVLAKHLKLELDSRRHGPKIDKPNVVPGGPRFLFNYLYTRLHLGFLPGSVS